jgi:hypothetical protein
VVDAPIAPWAGGLIADAFDLSATFYFLASLLVIANVLIMFVPEQPKRER